MDCPASVQAALDARPFDHRKLLEALSRHGVGWVTRIVTFATKQAGDDREDLVLEVFKRLGSKTLDPSGLDCPPAWLARVIANDARDALRTMKAKKRGGDAIQETYEESSTVDLRQAVRSNPEAKIDAGRTLSKLARVAVDLEAPIAARPRLGFLAYFMAQLIVKPHIDSAATQPDRSRRDLEGGLLRTADETWGLLAHGLLRSWPMGVHDDELGKLELAFVLRSTHAGPANDWARVDGKVTAKACDLVRKWAGRGREQVIEAAGAAGLVSP